MGNDEREMLQSLLKIDQLALDELTRKLGATEAERDLWRERTIFALSYSADYLVALLCTVESLRGWGGYGPEWADKIEELATDVTPITGIEEVLMDGLRDGLREARKMLADPRPPVDGSLDPIVAERHQLKRALIEEGEARRSFMVAATEFGNANSRLRDERELLRAVATAASSYQAAMRKRVEVVNTDEPDWEAEAQLAETARIKRNEMVVALAALAIYDGETDG